MSIDKKMMCAGIGLALLGPVAARAQDAGELSRIRREIAELKAAYESRIRALESRLEAMQAWAGQSAWMARRGPAAGVVRAMWQQAQALL